MKPKPISLVDVKQALRDSRFRDSLPKEFLEDIQKYLSNPGCGCNIPIYKNILKNGAEQLKAYFPGREVSDIDAEVRNLAKNNFSVINCHKDELEAILKKLPIGRKQIAITRYQDEITCIINELDLVY